MLSATRSAKSPIGWINGETEEESEFLTPKNGTGNECLMARLKTGGSECRKPPRDNNAGHTESLESRHGGRQKRGGGGGAQGSTRASFH